MKSEKIKKHILRNIVSSIGININKFINLFKLLFQYINDKTYSEYLQDKGSVDKKLKQVIIEWIFDYLLKYVMIGVLISFAIPLNWYQSTIGYWFIFRVLWLLKKGE